MSKIWLITVLVRLLIVVVTQYVCWVSTADWCFTQTPCAETIWHRRRHSKYIKSAWLALFWIMGKMCKIYFPLSCCVHTSRGGWGARYEIATRQGVSIVQCNRVARTPTDWELFHRRIKTMNKTHAIQINLLSFSLGRKPPYNYAWGH